MLNKVIIQIVILSYNRPDYLRETIDSVLKQSNNEYDLSISDNSSNNLVKKMMRKHFPNIKYFKQKKVLTAIEHFNYVLKKISKQYFVIFHDDDLMNLDFIKSIKYAISDYPNVGAIGVNASLIGKRGLFSNNKKTLIFKDPKDLAKLYCLNKPPAPFPSYVFNSKIIDRISLNHHEGGKYSDVSFLLNCLMKAPFIILPDPLISYRIHANNDSKTFNLTHRLMLMNHLINKIGICKYSEEIKYFRMYTMYNVIKSNNNSIRTKKKTLLKIFTFCLKNINITVKIIFDRLSRKLNLGYTL